MFDPRNFTAPTAKPLPVILLLDVSGSMHGEKIQSLNEAVRNMLQTFRENERGEIEIHVAIITFGAEVNLHQALTSASNITWCDLTADGPTPLGVALSMAKAMIEDKNVIPSRAYRPAVILVSDGVPTDDWFHPMNDFINQGRSSKCDRIAMAIGADMDEKGALGNFIERTERPLFYAENAGQLREFFKYVTMSVTTRSISSDKNTIPAASAIDAHPATFKEKSVTTRKTSISDGSDANEGNWAW